MEITSDSPRGMNPDESRGNAGEPLTTRFKAAAAFQLKIRTERALARYPRSRP
jgi:hypothetical protein